MGALAELELLIQSRYPLIAIETFEEGRLQKALEEVTSSLRMPFWVWTTTSGLAKVPALNNMYDTHEPLKALNSVAAMTGEGLFLMKDLHRYFERPEIVRKLRDVAPQFTMVRRVIALSGAKVELPAELATLAGFFTFGLPSTEELRAIARKVIETLSREAPVRVELSAEEFDRMVERMSGLTAFEAERALTKVILRDRALRHDDLELLVETKKELLKKEGLLEYLAPEENLAEVGGFDVLKDWLWKRKKAFTREAKQFGIQEPRGLLLLGVQGCGKTLVAKTVAKAWGLPLLKLEIGRLYDKFVGESEKNLEKALGAAERMAPCVLMIDEIEKGLSYSQSAEADAGLSRRIFGRLLGWLQDRKAPVFVVATCNNISQLPPELTRKGRFDEIFFIDLPSRDERGDIFAVHLKKRKRDPGGFDLDALAAASEGFSGAEIEQAVVSGLTTAFSRSVELTTGILLGELTATRPLSVTRREEIEALREWARDRTVMASTPTPAAPA